VIDILAIFTLNQLVNRDARRRASANQQARRILTRTMGPHSSSWDLLQKQATDAQWLLSLDREP